MTDSGLPTTTIVIAVWDRYVGDRLSEAVTSLATQDTPARIIVVDNASTVALPQLPAADVIKSPQRLTLGAARNLGLAAVQTDNVIVWDADDRMLAGTLAHLEQALARDPRQVAVAAAIIEEPSGLRHRWPRPWLARAVRFPRALAVLNAVWSTYPTTGATIMRTAKVRAAGAYPDADSGDDWCLGAALLFLGRVGWSERPGRQYLQHEGSVWSTYGGARHQLRHAAVVRRRLADQCPSPVVGALLPVLAACQYAAVGAHVLVVALRRRRGDRSPWLRSRWQGRG